MKEKVKRIEGAKVSLFEFDYEKKVYTYEIQAPTFDQLVAALGQVKTNGQIDIVGAGKVVWELCCTRHDVEIEADAKILVAVCIVLAREFVLPIDIDIKKK
jgi:hypothetical protein